MSFILVLKAEQETVTLLSEQSYGSRKEALAALSEITAQASFDRWDDDVIVVDLEKGTPVLLVRPVAAAAGAEPAPAESETATEETDDTESIVVIAEDAAEDAETADDASVEPAMDEPESADGEPESGGSLKDALARTAAQMEADGITAPDSVGPADESDAEPGDDEEPAEEPADAEEAAEEPADEPAEEEAWPWATPSATEPVDESAEEPDDVSDEESDDVEAEESDDVEAVEPADAVEVEPADAFTLSALEEPGVDEGSLVRTAGDEDTMAVSRPMILGDYDDAPAVEPMSFRGAESSNDDQVSIEPGQLADSLAVALDETQAESDVAGGQDGEPSEVVSDFILDMETAEVAQPEESAGYQAATDDSPKMSCSDCVYVNTCPNKGERDPASCGSFQWK